MMEVTVHHEEHPQSPPPELLHNPRQFFDHAGSIPVIRAQPEAQQPLAGYNVERQIAAPVIAA